MTVEMVETMQAAVAGLESGQSIAIGGFGGSGLPLALVDAVCDTGITDLHIVSNNGGLPNGEGIARLLDAGRVRKLTCSFPSNASFLSQFAAGTVELELVPQGTLAERLRAGGSGIPAFYTPTSADTDLALGELPSRLGASGCAVEHHRIKEHRMIDGRRHVLEHAIRPHVALVHARDADAAGNLRFRLGARNFNPVCAMAAALTIVQAERVVDSPILPDDVHLPGIFVDRVVRVERALQLFPLGAQKAKDLG